MAPLLRAATPIDGERAPEFALVSVDGKTVRLSEMISEGPVALIGLRGYRGYQCSFCNRQVQDFIRNSQGFADADIQILMVYPGPAQDLGSKANEFLADKKLLDDFELLLDPGYQFTNLYGLRWDSPHETAYPSTFLINGESGVIFFNKIVKEYADRMTAADVLSAVPKAKAVH